jgi:oligosaccharide repeat unit polymerase
MRLLVMLKPKKTTPSASPTSDFSKIFTLRRSRALPFYCHPVSLFLATWVLMLACLRLQISYVSYPNFSLPFFIFVISFVSFLFGYLIIRLVSMLRKRSDETAAYYQVNFKKLRKFNLVLILIALIIFLMNLVTSGIPPLFGFFGLNTTSYLEYGKLRQLLFPLLVTLFVNALLDSSRLRKLICCSFAFFILLCYVARGSVMIMLLQILIVFSIRTSIPKSKIYLIAICGAIGAAFFVDIIGSNRTGDQIFFFYMQIKTEFQHWPTVYTWIISYVSTPLSNFCWFVDSTRFDHPTWTFAYPLLPHFWWPEDPHMDLVETSKIIDGVHSYLSSYFLDFSYFGIILINFWVGLVSGYCSIAGRISRKFLTCSVFLASIGFMFFTDFFLYLQTFIEVGIQCLAHWYFIKEARSENLTANTQPAVAVD